MGMAYWFARRYNLPRGGAFPWARVRQTVREALWAFLLPIIILGGIFGGVVTATEGAALAVVAALFVGLVIYRELDLAHLQAAVIEGGVQTAVVMLLVATSALLGTYLTEVQAPQQLAQAVSDFTHEQVARARAAQRAVPAARHVPAFGGGDHPRRAGRDAAGARGRHRPGAFRPHRHHQSRHRPADAAGRERADGRQRHRQGSDLGGDARQRLVHRACCSRC